MSTPSRCHPTHELLLILKASPVTPHSSLPSLANPYPIHFHPWTPLLSVTSSITASQSLPV
ncbi:hypothetical protein BDQ17DRAFT_1363289, partial [Cyathus striatus]